MRILLQCLMFFLPGTFCEVMPPRNSASVDSEAIPAKKKPESRTPAGADAAAEVEERSSRCGRERGSTPRVGTNEASSSMEDEEDALEWEMDRR